MSEQGNVVDFERKRVEIRFRRLTERLMAFVNGSQFGAVAATGLRKFMSEAMDEDGEYADGAPAGVRDEPDDLENEFIEWLVLDYEDEEVGATLIHTFLVSLAEDELDEWEDSCLPSGHVPRPAVMKWSTWYPTTAWCCGCAVRRSYDVIAPDIGVGILRWSAVVTRLLAVDDVHHWRNRSGDSGAAAAICPSEWWGMCSMQLARARLRGRLD